MSCLMRLTDDQCTNRLKKNKSVWKQINPLFFLIFSLHIFLLLVIYSNDRDIKQCFVGKSPLEFYGL